MDSATMSELSGRDPEVESEPQVLCPVDDCTLEVDIQLKSSDGTVFGAHRSNLSQYSDGFPLAASTNVVTRLHEKADIASLILRYMHNARQPDLSEVPFRILSALAEAVEKYKIYSAMEVCKVHMALAIEEHPVPVLMYSTKHDYPKLANKAALLTVGTSSTTFMEEARKFGLNDNHAYQWFRYRDRWTAVLTRAVLEEIPPVMHKGGFSSCADWAPFHSKIVHEVGRDLSTLTRFGHTIARHSSRVDECTHCKIRSENWRKRVDNEVAAIPEFSNV